MFYFTDSELDGLVMEHLGNFDVTTSMLRLENKMAKIQFTTRESTVVCCTEEAMRIFTKFGIQTTLFTPSGEMIEQDIKFFEGEGLAKGVQAVLPAVKNLLEFASGMATRARLLIEKSHEIKPEIMVATARYAIPNTKKITNKAIKAAGGTTHTNELSDTILVNESHLNFIGGIDKLEERLHQHKNPVNGKKIITEVNTMEDALKITGTGIDILQLNHLPVKEIKAVKKEISRLKSDMQLAAVDCITPDNIKEYADSGADILVTSWLSSGDPAGFRVTVSPIFDVY